MKISETARRALQSIEPVVKEFGDEKTIDSYYLEFLRRALVIDLVIRYCPRGCRLADLGAQPFILSCGLAKLGYGVVAVDIDPEPYMNIARSCGVTVVKADLERDELNIGEVECVVLSEVLEHLNPYYVPYVMAKVNGILESNGRLILSTPNVASLFRRLKLLLGVQPVYRYHVREYTRREVEELLRSSGFEIIESFYSEVNDLAFVNADRHEYMILNGYGDLLKIALRRPTRLNLLRALAYPIVKIVPSLRMIMAIVAEKIHSPRQVHTERW